MEKNIMALINKFRYLAISTKKRISGAGNSCPSCGCIFSSLVARKYIVTELRRCDDCDMMFRVPTTSDRENFIYYNKLYEQGFTTEMPSDTDLEIMKNTGFSGTDRDYSKYLNILENLGVRPTARIFDFGCSWGYGSFQLTKQGYDVTSFEISESRRRFAQKKLGVKVIDRFDLATAGQEMKESFDVFFSSHVLEHVPSPGRVLQVAWDMLKPGGLFVAITPNGSDEYRAVAPASWMQLWGEVHPNFIDGRFWQRQCRHGEHYFLGTIPVPAAALKNFMSGEQAITRSVLQGDELVFAARRV